MLIDCYICQQISVKITDRLSESKKIAHSLSYYCYHYYYKILDCDWLFHENVSGHYFDWHDKLTDYDDALDYNGGLVCN